MYEVHRKQLVNYGNGKLYGAENGQFTKALPSEKDDKEKMDKGKPRKWHSN